MEILDIGKLSAACTKNSFVCTWNYYSSMVCGRVSVETSHTLSYEQCNASLQSKSGLKEFAKIQGKTYVPESHLLRKL